jgi:hypothetical protein
MATASESEDDDTYRYEPLDRDAQEIRLLRILPGNFDDELKLEIFHAPLVMPEKAPDTRLDIDELQKTLPEGCNVYKTLEGRYIFCDLSDLTIQWAHPVKNFGRKLYDSLAVLDPYPSFEPRYEG